MQFRYSGGSVNSAQDFLINGKAKHIEKLLLLVIGFVLVKFMIFYYSHPETQEQLKEFLVLGYCVFASVLYSAYLVIFYRLERYASFAIRDDVVYEYFKGKEVDNVKITLLCYFKTKVFGSRVNFLIFFKRAKFIEMKSFGLVDEQLASEIEKCLLLKGIEKWAYDRIPK